MSDAEAEAIWAAKPDDELLEASGELSEYTEEGERVIRAELKRRGLPEPDPPIGRCSRCGRSIARNDPSDECAQCGEAFPPEIVRMFSTQTPEAEIMPVLRTGDAGLILLAKSLLEREGIEYLVRGENLQDPFGGGRLGGRTDVTGPAEFWVSARDAEVAKRLLDGLDVLPQEPAADSHDDV